MRFYISSLALVWSLGTLFGQQDYSAAYTALLYKTVSSSGTVNYAELKKAKPTLDKIVMDLADNPVSHSASKNEQLAYWINLYNASTLKLVVSHYPVKSILDINNGKPWDLKIVKSGTELYTLNQIEHEIIRPEFKDARIHFALNCAAISCPPLLNKAYTASDLDQVLDIQTKKFITSSKNQWMSNKAELSKLFEWYREDFGNLIQFINKYADNKLNESATLVYAQYNWALNQ